MASKRLINRWSVLTVVLIVGAGLVFLFRWWGVPVGKIVWERQLPENEYVLCLATREDTGRSILMAGIQMNLMGSRDFDTSIVCFDLATGAELWRRLESKAGKLGAWKRPISMDFDGSGNLIVGWSCWAGEAGDFVAVSKHSAKDGTLIWGWKTPSEGWRPHGMGDSPSAKIFCDGTDVFVKAERTIGSRDGHTNMQEFYSIIDSSTGTPAASSSSWSTTAEARWRSREDSLRFIAADGSEIAWGIHSYEHTETNWLRWENDGGWIPKSHWERRERVQVTRTSTKSPSSPEHFLVGRDNERAILLLYKHGAGSPSAAILIDVEKKAQIEGWRVVQVTHGRAIGRTLARGDAMIHYYNGPITLTKGDYLVISGAMQGNQSSQKITVWK